MSRRIASLYRAPTLEEIGEALVERGIEHVVAEHPGHAGGTLIATADCARVIGIAKDWTSPSVLWCDPRLMQPGEALPMGGAVGGERLWFAPEIRFHWHGEPDWIAFSNYSPPGSIDPGRYTLSRSDPGTVTFQSEFEAIDDTSSPADQVRVVKEARIRDGWPHPALPKGLTGFRVEFSIILEVTTFETDDAIGIWSLLQFPPNARISIPLNPGSTTRSQDYSPVQPWRVRRDRFDWSVVGTETAKIGFAASQLHGVASVTLPSDDDNATSVVVRFPHPPDAEYCDHPYGVPRSDQVVQVWDGYGFGEFEIHSPLARARKGNERTSLTYELQVISGTSSTLSEYIETQVRQSPSTPGTGNTVEPR